MSRLPSWVLLAAAAGPAAAAERPSLDGAWASQGHPGMARALQVLGTE